jgi:hypothetical protein
MVGIKRLVSTGCVAAATRVAKKGERAVGSTLEPGGVAQKRQCASGGVVVSRVKRSAPAPMAVFKFPVMFAKANANR